MIRHWLIIAVLVGVIAVSILMVPSGLVCLFGTKWGATAFLVLSVFWYFLPDLIDALDD